MRTRLVLVAALLGCGGNETPQRPVKDAGADAAEAYVERDAGQNSGRDVEQGGAGGDEEPIAGSGGEVAGQMAVGGSGGQPNPPPEGGAGAPAEPPQGGSPAPQERVLWSQSWTVAVHDPIGYGAVEGTKMALILDAGQLCRFGFMAADSGSTQEYETDGRCITAFSAPSGAAAFYAPDGSSSSTGRAGLVGWKEAVRGKTVLRLRRTQTYETQVLGVAPQAWSYADFTGKWEAVGY